MTGMLRGVAFDVQDATVMEVGTCWRVDMPIGFYLAGARKIITCDLRCGMWRTTRTRSAAFSLPWNRRSSTSESQICVAYKRSKSCFARPASSVTRHVEILREANRLLSDRGVALHHIDLGDHFAQVDPSITPANFLQFSEAAWRRYAKTSWSYHNRLREDEYRSLLERVPQDIHYWKAHIDERSLESLRQGFPLAPQFRKRPIEVLSVALLDVISRPACIPPSPRPH